MGIVTREHNNLPILEALEPRMLLSGTTYVVNSLADWVATDGVVTLREAIEAANTNVAVHNAPAGSSTEADIVTFSASLTGRAIMLYAEVQALRLPILGGKPREYKALG